MDLHGTQGESFGSTFGVEFYGNIALNASQLDGIADIRAGASRMFYNTTIGAKPQFQYYWGEYMACPAESPEAQMIHDTYNWNNRRDYTGATGTFYISSVHTPVCGSYGNRPTAGRDFFNESTTTPGATCGPLASRPTTCVVGQAYWATDQSTTDLTGLVGDIQTYPMRKTISGTLYKCTATNVWTAYYTPLVYPHPVRTLAN
jgi:hypothetical protein